MNIKNIKAKIESFVSVNPNKSLLIVALLSTLAGCISSAYLSNSCEELPKTGITQKKSNNVYFNLVNLDEMEVTKTKLEAIKDENGIEVGKKFKVYYRHKDENGNTIWLTIRELILPSSNQIKLTKKEYDKYVKANKEKGIK